MHNRCPVALNLAASAQEAEDKQRKEQEAADLEDEAAKRRQRVSLWQEQRRAAQQAEEAEQKKREATAEMWTLDDDMENEFGQVSGRAAAAQDFTEGSGEVDPLDAFMAENDKTIVDAAAGEDDEIDPLDAFMAAEIAPAVRRDMAATTTGTPQAVASTADAQALVKVEDGADVKPEANVLQVCISVLPSTLQCNPQQCFCVTAS